MNFRTYLIAVHIVGALVTAQAVSASTVEIQQYSIFLASPDLPGTLQDDQLGLLFDPGDPFALTKENTFEGFGIDVSFSSNIDANGFGSADWILTNTGGVALSAVHLIGFLDADLSMNLYFNEYAEIFGNLSSDYASWEADEPFFPFGDIYENVLAGSLDNTISLPSSSPGDVALALAFSFPFFDVGDQFLASFTTSELPNPGRSGLSQFDVDTGAVVYFSGVSSKISAVPEPASWLLFLSGVCSLFLRKRLSKV